LKRIREEIARLEIFGLNATVGAAWDACSSPTTLSKVAEDMQRSFDPGITEELALEAILQLEQKNLVTTSGSSSNATRRQVFATVSAIALPLVVSLTVAEQRAHASGAGSGSIGTTVFNPGTTSSTTFTTTGAPTTTPFPTTTAAPTTTAR
jgi:hypothetical protein